MTPHAIIKAKTAQSAAPKKEGAAGGPLPSEAWHEIQPEQVFRCSDGEIVKIERSVPGEAWKWYVATWSGKSFAYYDATIHSGDLVERLPDTFGQQGAESMT